MCGHVGIYGNITHQLKQVFNQLLLLDILRGKDGTGIYYHDGKNGKIVKHDDITPSLYFENQDEFNPDLTIKADNLQLLLGHNRATTRGLSNMENTHPFEFDNIVGAHNGTLQLMSLKNFPQFKELNMDSRILFSGIDAMENGDHPVFESMQDVVDEADGAMALVWWNKKRNTLNFFRNKDRPLHYCFGKDFMIWASEPWMIFVATQMFGVEVGKAEELPVDKYYEMKFTPNGEKKFKLVQNKEFKKKKFQQTGGTRTTTGGITNFSPNNQQYHQNKNTQGNVGKNEKEEKEKAKGNVLQLPPVDSRAAVWIFNKQYTKKEFDSLVHLGCCFCCCSISYSERYSIGFLAKGAPLCHECMTSASIGLVPPKTLKKLERVHSLSPTERAKYVH